MSTETVEKVETVENTETTENVDSNSTQASNENTQVETAIKTVEEQSNSVNNDELERLRVENTKLKVANKYKLTDEQMSILGVVDDDFEKRAEALSIVVLDKAKNSVNALQRDPNIGQRNTHSKVVTGNDWLGGVVDSMN